MKRRTCKRYETNLYVKLRSDSPLFTCWGVLCDASETGLFIKSILSMAVNTVLDIEIFMPNLSACHLRGVAKRVVELPGHDSRYGIGIELTGKTVTLDRLVEFLDSRRDEQTEIGCPASGGQTCFLKN